jgi:hypothetical protein
LRPDRQLPAVVVEHISETRVRPTRQPVVRGSATVAVHPPGYVLVERVAAVIAMVRQDYARTIGTHRDFHPRTHSRVEHRIDAPAADALATLRLEGDVDVHAGPVCLTVDGTGPSYDRFEHEYRIPCRLHLPWSWPELPMWLAVGEVSATRGALRLSLRSRKRLRYPARYFHAAHAVLSRLESRLR